MLFPYTSFRNGKRFNGQSGVGGYPCTLKPESLGQFSARCVGVLDDGPSSFVINKLLCVRIGYRSAVALFWASRDTGTTYNSTRCGLLPVEQVSWKLPSGQTLSFRDTASDKLLTLHCLVTYLWADGQSYLNSGHHNLKKTGA